jgi:EAL and modified HD-GYP domain-containing signal transduction protein
LQARGLEASKLSLLQLIAEVNKADVELDKVESMINRDVSLSYKLMRYINSAFFRRVEDIASIKQALVMLGQRGVRQFVTLIAAAALASAKPGELIRTAIIRARFCERLAAHPGVALDREELFLMGLFSLIDAMLDTPMDDVLTALPLSPAIKDALRQGAGPMAEVLSVATFYEAGDWPGCLGCLGRIGADPERVPADYMEAVGWADACPLD